MNRKELDYVVSNAQFAAHYLEDISLTKSKRSDINKVYNHILAVQQLILTAKKLYDQNEILHNELESALAKVHELQAGEFKNQLDAQIEQIKSSLIEMIKLYPDVEY